MLGPGLGAVGTKRDTGPTTTKFFHLQLERCPFSPSWSTLSPTVGVFPSTSISDGRGAGHHHSGDTSEGLGCELQERMLRWRWISNSEHWLHN